MNLCAFSAAQEVFNKLENQAKCNSVVFVTNPLKIHFSYTFWLLEVAIIIARTNYNCEIGHRAQPDENYEENLISVFLSLGQG